MRPVENYSDHESGSWDSNHPDHGFSDAAMSDHREDGASSGASTPRGDIQASLLGVFSGASNRENSPSKPSRDSGDESERKPAISRILSSKAEAWMGKKGFAWPWKGNEHDGTDPKSPRFVWPWEQQDNELEQKKSASAENQFFETNRTANNEAAGSWSSSVNVNSTSSASSCGSTCSSTVNKLDIDSDSLDYEILWEDMTIGEQIGQG